MSRTGRLLAVLLLLSWVCAAPASSREVVGSTLVLRPPTDAPVLDPFRLPNGQYGAGNRGIEYDTERGDTVVAAGGGTVAFSGAVGGSLFVSIDHPGGLRSTYGFIEAALVRTGAVVRPGQAIARVAGPFHFTVRLNGEYLDPADLFGRHRVRVALVPHGSATGQRLAAANLPLHCPAVRSGLGRCQFGTGEITVSGQYPVASASGPDVQPGKKADHGSHLHEAVVGGRSSLRSSDPPLESEDEAVHPR